MNRSTATKGGLPGMTENPELVILIGPRACGKSTVAQELADELGGWQAVDLDHEYHRHTGRGSTFSSDTKKYFEQSKKLLRERLSESQKVIALGGGTLINAEDIAGDFQLVAECRERAALVLLLPTRFDLLNRRILYSREKDRDYLILNGSKRDRLKDMTCKQYDDRITFFRNNADLIVYGCSPAKSVRKIIKNLKLRT